MKSLSKSKKSLRKVSRTTKLAQGIRSRPHSTVAKPLRKPADDRWTYLTNHAHVLVLLSLNPSLVLREVALHIGITERAVQRIIADFDAEGVIEREKIGRRNQYRIKLDKPLRHPVVSHRTIGDLIAIFG